MLKKEEQAQMKKVSHKQLEAGIAIGFSLIIVILSNTKIGYIPISDYQSMDLSLIPAMFAAMIGGYRIGIPVAIVWAVAAYSNDYSNLQIYTIWGLLVNKLILVVAATWFYKFFKCRYQYSPHNVYRTIVASITVKSIVSAWIFFTVLVSLGIDASIWISIKDTVARWILEIALSSLFMSLLIKHLRQIHILNGVKRKKMKEDQDGKANRVG